MSTRQVEVGIMLLWLLPGTAWASTSPGQAAGGRERVPTETITLRVEMRDPGKCPLAVEQALKKLPEVVAVEVKFEKKLVVVQGNRVKVEALVKALQEAGYAARVARPEEIEPRGKGREGTAK